jgi:hypothetical protein
VIEWLPVGGLRRAARALARGVLLVGTWFVVYLLVKGTYIPASIDDASFFGSCCRVPGLRPARRLDRAARPGGARAAAPVQPTAREAPDRRRRRGVRRLRRRAVRRDRGACRGCTTRGPRRARSRHTASRSRARAGSVSGDGAADVARLKPRRSARLLHTSCGRMRRPATSGAAARQQARRQLRPVRRRRSRRRAHDASRTTRAAERGLPDRRRGKLARTTDARRRVRRHEAGGRHVP